MSAVYQPYIRRISAVYPPYIRHMSAVCRPSISRISAVCQPYIRCMSAVCQPWNGRMSAVYQPYVRRMSAIPNLSICPLLISILTCPIFKLYAVEPPSTVYRFTIFPNVPCRFSLFCIWPMQMVSLRFADTRICSYKSVLMKWIAAHFVQLLQAYPLHGEGACVAR